MIFLIVTLVILAGIIGVLFKTDNLESAMAMTCLSPFLVALVLFLEAAIPYSGPSKMLPLSGAVYDNPITEVLAFSDHKDEIIPYGGDYIIKVTNKVKPSTFFRLFSYLQTYILVPQDIYGEAYAISNNGMSMPKISNKYVFEVATNDRINKIVENYLKYKEPKDNTDCNIPKPATQTSKTLVCSFEALTFEKTSEEVIIRRNNGPKLIISLSSVIFEDYIENTDKIIVDKYEIVNSDNIKSEEYVIYGGRKAND